MSLLEQVSSLLSYLPEVAFPRKKAPAYANPPVMAQPTFHLADMSSITRIAGLSGAVAVALGAYGGHMIRDDEKVEIRRKNAFEAGSRYHLIHTLGLLAAHKARYPWMTTAIFVGGIVMFCGPCYHYSITGQTNTRKFAPIGGVLFILGWLTFIL
ncbi:unnamed protein product [Cylicocyclus nassatus]|uniref:Transmembrane protein 256-like protein n=1 Tax=Cylicocyclus nassatus TaxID=53992 RepID=A0AA36GJX4_CYLNA|nr:unnamed protein product [Cylicocyclus nassatus]